MIGLPEGVERGGRNVALPVILSAQQTQLSGDGKGFGKKDVIGVCLGLGKGRHRGGRTGKGGVSRE